MSVTTSVRLPRTDRAAAIPANSLDLRTLPLGNATTRARAASLLAGCLGFFGLMPYLCVSAGNHTALQFGVVFGLVATAATAFMPWVGRPFWIYVAIAASLAISTAGVAMNGPTDVAVSFKTSAVWMWSLATLVATQVLAPRYALSLLTGAAVATLIHFAVGLWQQMVFESGQFPLLWLYVNPSFLSVQDNAEKIARWQRRPFGIFPEPSAMSSSLAPFVLMWTAYLLGLVRFHVNPAHWQRLLFAAAAVGGMLLIIISQSGHAAITLAAAGLFVAIWFVRARATGRTFAALVGLFGIALPAALFMAAASLGKRVGGGKLGNSSWEDRTDSLIIGAKLWFGGNIGTLLWGLGIGGTSPILQRDHKLEAVWSVLLTYVYETGLIGVVVVLLVAWHLMRTWRAASFSVVMVAVVVVWLVGVTVTTSYKELLSLWMTLGWLTVWPAILANGAEVRTTVAPPSVAVQPLPLESYGGRRRWVAE
jgi:hypothetical protein